MAKFKKGDFVRIAEPLDGAVEAVKFNEDTGEPRFLVIFTKDDEPHERWFNEAELAALPA